MGGGLLQLVAYGAQDIYLTGNPQITFFKVVYRRHTNFSMECIKQVINGHKVIGITNINNKGTVLISKTGDLVTNIYVRCNQNTSSGLCGDLLVEDVELEIGGHRIDKQYREWNQIWSELTIPKSKQDGFKYMTGGFNNNEIPIIDQQSIMYPLNFWFCRNPGLALPLIALQYHDVHLKFTWGKGIYSSDLKETILREKTSLTTDHPVEVWVDYIYLDTDERRRFAQVSHEYLIEQLQVQREKDQSKKMFTLNLEHPVKELIWTNPNTNPITTEKCKIIINGHNRFSEQDKEYFQIKQPFNHHTSIPGYNIKEVENPVFITPIAAGPYNLQKLSGNDSTNLSSVLSSNGDAAFGIMISTTVDGIVTETTDEAKNTLILSEDTTTKTVFKPGDILSINITDISATGKPSVSNFFKVMKIRSSAVIVVDKTFSELTLDRNPLTIFASDGTPLVLDDDIMTITIIGRTNIPQSNCSQLKKDINIYSFALEPEEHQPSGTCNFSRIETANLEFSDKVCISNIYAVNYNVLRIMSGMAGIAYMS